MAGVDLEHLQSWIGREETREDLLAPSPAQALAATLDRDPNDLAEGAVLPPLYHWIYFPYLTPSSELAADGHAKKGDFMPPVPFPRRMFAGARVDSYGALRIGERVQRVASIRSVSYKEGRSGELVFVTVSYRFSDSEGLKLVEEQDIAYRPATEPQSSATQSAAPLPGADFARTIIPDERLLFRFSALTFNAHRIHYDLPYARGEGYPALVVHGPLTAVLLADLAIREVGAQRLAHFSFRAMRAFFLGDRINLLGRRAADTLELTAVGDNGIVGMAARAVTA